VTRRGSLGRWRLPLGVVAVAGPSMAPALVAGDLLVISPGRHPRAGAVVVARRPAESDILIVKRVLRAAGPAAWWLEGDNPFGSDDSRVYGPVPTAAVVGTAIWRYWPPSRFGPVPVRRDSDDSAA
jgi:phage repressor protein C with HTH and peptisase S24 domain